MAPHQDCNVFSVHGLDGQAEGGRFQTAFFERLDFGINMFHLINFERMKDRRSILHPEICRLLAVFQLKYRIVEQQYRSWLVECGGSQDNIEHLLYKGAAVRRFAQNEQKWLHGCLTKNQETVGALNRVDQLPEPCNPEARRQIVIVLALPFGFVAA
jgi:hypothetical protein